MIAPFKLLATYSLPYPPSHNRVWRAVGSRVILSAAARRYHKDVQNALPQGKVTPLTERDLIVVLEVRPPKGKAMDTGNAAKIVLDALTRQRIWKDDSQVGTLIERRGPTARSRRDAGVTLLIARGWQTLSKPPLV